MRKKKDVDFLTHARKRFKDAADYEFENREEALEDLEFVAGEQWPDEIRSNRDNDHQPCLTINRLPGFIRQLVSDARQNKPAIKVHPVDDQGDVETAEIYNGLIRQIEMASNADQAYDTAVEQSASSGFGFFRILTEYSNDDVFEQDIKIRRITNNFSVYCDPNAKEYDKSDGRWLFVTELLDEEVFEEKYPKAGKIDWESDTRAYNGWYVSQKQVRIAEYWVKERDTKVIHQLSSGEVVENVDPEELLALGLEVKASREVKYDRIMRYLITGAEILEKAEWAGRYIPVVPVYGPELHIENRVIYHSLIRFAKDPQRLYNYWQSAIAEKIALTPKSPFVMTPKQVAGYETWWNNANVENRAYLLFNPDVQNPGPPQRQMPAALNPAELQQSAQAVEDLKSTTGIYDASMGNRSNETSGRAIIARQREGDAATFTWLDNLSRSISYAGRILIDLIPKIYDTERVVRILGEDGIPDFKPINSVAQGPNGPVKIHDLTAGKYDLVVTVGPNYATQRIEAQDVLMKFAGAVPQAGQVAPDIIARMLDVQYADELADRLKKTLPPGLVEPEEGEEPPPPPPPPQPTPEQMIELAKAEQEQEKTKVEIEGKWLDNAQKSFDLSQSTGQMQQQIEQTVVGVLQRMNQGMM